MVLGSKVSMVSKQTEAVNKGGEEFPSQSNCEEFIVSNELMA